MNKTYLNKIKSIIDNTGRPKNMIVDIVENGELKGLEYSLCPPIQRIIFNDPVTKVFFKDGTNVILKKSKHDEFSKEHAIIYAIIKRMWGKVEDNLSVDSNGYMCKLKKFVDNAWDQPVEEKRLAEEKKIRKEKYKEMLENKMKKTKIKENEKLKETNNKHVKKFAQKRDKLGRFK